MLTLNQKNRSYSRGVVPHPCLSGAPATTILEERPSASGGHCGQPGFLTRLLSDSFPMMVTGSNVVGPFAGLAFWRKGHGKRVQKLAAGYLTTMANCKHWVTLIACHGKRQPD